MKIFILISIILFGPTACVSNQMIESETVTSEQIKRINSDPELDLSEREIKQCPNEEVTKPCETNEPPHGSLNILLYFIFTALLFG